MIQVYSWNVNGIRACARKGFAQWVASASPEAFCLQETKARTDQVDEDLLNPLDKDGNRYRSWWSSAVKPGYSGVAIYSRKEPRSVSGLGISEFDDEGRFLAADFGSFILVSAYFPNSQEAGARLDYKLRFCDAMLDWCDARVREGRHVVVGGDYNIAHNPVDLANPKANEGNPGYLPEERAWMDRFTGAGYVDSFRSFVQDGGHYSWWTYRVPKARERNIGWRLDYHCTDVFFRQAILAARIHPEVQGSDHCPVSIDLDVEPDWN